MKEQTIWENLKENWIIKKKTISDLGIDPNKNWDQIMLCELETIAFELDVLVSDLL
ncbi:MAG: hypothetical protein ACXVDV_20035 [Bacteroidia bacterium]